MAQWKQAPTSPEADAAEEVGPAGFDAIPEFPDLGYLTVMGMEVSSAAVLLPGAILALTLVFVYARRKQDRRRG